MAAKYIIRKRRNTILYVEFFIVALATSLLLFKYFKLHPAIAFLVAIASFFISAFLFFSKSIFRYLFSLLFSLAWAFIAFFTGHLLETKTDMTAWTLALLAFVISIWAHRDHFKFIKEAQLFEYERV